MWILLKQETVSGSGISWAVCKSARRFRQLTTKAPHHSVFTGRMPVLSPNQQRQSTEGYMTLLVFVARRACSWYAAHVAIDRYPLHTGCSAENSPNAAAAVD